MVLLLGHNTIEDAPDILDGPLPARPGPERVSEEETPVFLSDEAVHTWYLRHLQDEPFR